ncbi:hypothetical protein BEWA_046600 [Theileria equi strain WA]|uniref:AP2/ERF domain-containing protein n=1 Tax=Theileria equi strain WA TaxID=1537102 RepID=L1L9M3_THEEQ|nr:hypothetical protein BEWA_046600 [Theileria equi strain WA]EKX72196.1 hypothetical protein BEWA_046600 [Theileria equi strain WA]|eukprot:XP_004831648.1 hypothetical protein BEWA_046600 [Theileria equi strain WA]
MQILNIGPEPKVDVDIPSGGMSESSAMCSLGKCTSGESSVFAAAQNGSSVAHSSTVKGENIDYWKSTDPLTSTQDEEDGSVLVSPQGIKGEEKGLVSTVSISCLDFFQDATLEPFMDLQNNKVDEQNADYILQDSTRNKYSTQPLPVEQDGSSSPLKLADENVSKPKTYHSDDRVESSMADLDKEVMQKISQLLAQKKPKNTNLHIRQPEVPESTSCASSILSSLETDHSHVTNDSELPKECISEVYLFLLQMKLLNTLDLVKAVCRPWGVPPNGTDYAFHFDKIASAKSIHLLHQYESIFAPIYERFKYDDPAHLWTRVGDLEYFKIIHKLECLRNNVPFNPEVYKKLEKETKERVDKVDLFAPTSIAQDSKSSRNIDESEVQTDEKSTVDGEDSTDSESYTLTGYMQEEEGEDDEFDISLYMSIEPKHDAPSETSTICLPDAPLTISRDSTINHTDPIPCDTYRDPFYMNIDPESSSSFAVLDENVIEPMRECRREPEIEYGSSWKNGNEDTVSKFGKIVVDVLSKHAKGEYNEDDAPYTKKMKHSSMRYGSQDAYSRHSGNYSPNIDYDSDYYRGQDAYRVSKSGRIITNKVVEDVHTAKQYGEKKKRKRKRIYSDIKVPSNTTSLRLDGPKISVVSASVSYDKRQQRFMAQWKTKEGTKHSKSFYAKRYASPLMARKHAELYKMYILQHKNLNMHDLKEPTYEELAAQNFEPLDKVDVCEWNEGMHE